MATNQLLMLETISSEYHTFRKDQVLTEVQLNEVVNFFEDQDRLTRTCLIGVGLVCGLNIVLDASAPSVTITKGTAVTTDGDLLLMDTTTYLHFKSYDNRKKGSSDIIYDPFFPATGAPKQLPLWELVVPNGAGELPQNTESLSAFAAVSGSALADVTALLYLEYYSQEPDQCTAIDCDNQGALQHAQVKVLLLSKADMESIINRDASGEEPIADTIYKKYNDAATNFFRLPSLKAKRVVLNAANNSSIVLLSKSYTSIAQNGAAELGSAISDLYSAYQFVLDAANATDLNFLNQNLQQNLSKAVPVFQSQYQYDYYKDLVTGYNELKSLLVDCISECCPDKFAFPKHIMLGELLSSGARTARFRHEFYPSPAVTSNKSTIAKARLMWRRLEQMILQFNLLAQPTNIKITPSSDYQQPLEKRAIPFYYKEVATLANCWNYNSSRMNLQDSVLCYHAGQYSNADSTLNPLDYDIDTNDFFRVEGHLGKQLAEAMKDIDQLKNEKSLAFDIVALRMNKAGNLADIDTDDFDCQFEDLNAILKSWLIEQNCLYANIAKFFTGFSTKKDIGFHTRLEDYTAKVPPVFILPNLSFTPLKVATPFVASPLSSVVSNSSVRLLRRNLATGLAATAPPTAALAADATFRTAAASAFEASGIGATSIKSSINLADATAKTAGAFTGIKANLLNVDSTIVANLETSNFSLGTFFADTLKNNLLTADEIISDIKRKTINDDNLTKITAEEKELVFDTPLTLVAHISSISALKPFQLNEISMTSLDEYIKRMDRLCEYVKKVNGRLNGIFNSAAYVKHGFESQYQFLIQQLIANCCAAEKLESLQDEIDSRKKKILEGLLFANYANEHPGMEHKAGVGRGGTFVLVYAQNVKQGIRLIDTLNPVVLNPNAISNFINASAKPSLAAGVAGKAVPSTALSSLDAFAFHVVTQQDNVDFEKDLSDFKMVNQIKIGSLQDQIISKQLSDKIKVFSDTLTRQQEATVAANIVVADFTLPYICCSDCAPVAFIMPKQSFSLQLPKAAACSDDGKLLFKKEPADGVVKGPEGLGDAIENNADGRSLLDPSKVPQALLEKEISFTINEQVTDCKLTVFKHPVVAFEATVKEENADIILVEFTNLSDDATGTDYDYEWNFGDKRPIQKVENKEAISITYKKSFLKQLGLDGKIAVSLTAINGACTAVSQKEVAFNIPLPVSLSLPAAFTCDDAALLPFTVFPENAVVSAVSEPAAVIKNNEQFFFDPSKVQTFGRPVTFKVNGEPVGTTIIVYKHPAASFKFESTIDATGGNIMSVIFDNTSEPNDDLSLTYNWVFSDGTRKDTSSRDAFKSFFDVAKLKSANQDALTVSLLAKNPACESSVTVTVPFPVINQRMSCGDTVKDAINKDILLLRGKKVSNFLDDLKTTRAFTAIATQFSTTSKLLVNTLQVADRISNPAIQVKILSAIKSQLNELYSNQFEPKVNEVLIVLQIRVLLKLSLNIVKCQKQLNGDVRAQIADGILSNFTNRVPNLKEQFQTLNSDKELVNFIGDFLNDSLLEDQDLIVIIKAFHDSVLDNFSA